MSTDKCPKCGKQVKWSHHGFTCRCGEYGMFGTKEIGAVYDPFLPAAMHRIRELEAQRDAACKYLERLFVHILREHFPENNITQALSGDLIGLITQIDNALTAWRELEARIAAKDDVLTKIAAQKLVTEFDAEEYETADFEGGYIAIVELAREALKK